MIRSRSTIPQIVAFLELAAQIGDPVAFRDRIEYIP
jgi:hypothetical protein